MHKTTSFVGSRAQATAAGEFTTVEERALEAVGGGRGGGGVADLEEEGIRNEEENQEQGRSVIKGM